MPLHAVWTEDAIDYTEIESGPGYSPDFGLIGEPQIDRKMPRNKLASFAYT